MPQPGMPQPGMPQPGYGQQAFMQGGMAQPGMPQPGMPQPGFDNSGSGVMQGMPFNMQSDLKQGGVPLMQGMPQGPGSGARTFQVAVPPGAIAGQQLMTTSPEGGQVTVTVPPGANPGDVFAASY